MEYPVKQKKDVKVIDTVLIDDTYQVENIEEQQSSNDRRSYPAKRVRYERRNRTDPNSPYDNSIKIKT